MRAYDIALFFIVFGAIAGGINGAGIFDVVLPEHDIGASEAEIQEMTEGATSNDVSALYPFEVLVSVGKIVFSGLICALTILPLLISLGVPLNLAVMLQSPIWFVYAIAIIQFFSGRAITPME